MGTGTISSPVWAPVIIFYIVSGEFFPSPWKVSSYVCCDRCSDKDWRTLCTSLEVSEQLSFIWYSARELSYPFKESWTLCLRLLVLWPGNSLQRVSWGNCRTPLMCSPLAEITPLHCLMTSVRKLLFHIFSLVLFSVIIDRRFYLVPVIPPEPESTELNLIALNAEWGIYTLSCNGGNGEQFKSVQLGNIRCVFQLIIIGKIVWEGERLGAQWLYMVDSKSLFVG